MKSETWWGAWGACALMAGAAQLTADLPNKPQALSDLSIAMLMLAANVAVAAVLAALPFLVVAKASARLARPSQTSAVALAVGLATGFAFAPSLAGGVLDDVLSILRALLAAIGAAAVIAVVGERRIAAGRSVAGLVLFAGPWIALSAFALTASLVWMPRGERSAPLLVASGVSLLAVLIILSPSPRVQVRSAVSIGLAACLVAGLGGFGGARLLRGPPPPTASPAAACGVLLTIDTLRADTLRAYEPEAEAHPHLEALLADSVVFSQARSPAPWTKPAFASMLTGLPLHAHGATSVDSRVPERVLMLAERLQQSGRVTLAVVDNYVLEPKFGFAQGFDVYQHFPRPSLGGSAAARFAEMAGFYEPTVSSERLTDLAIAQLRAHAGEPFFLWLHYLDPHTPYALQGAYRPSQDPPPGMSTGWNDVHDARAGFAVRTPEQRRWLRQLYDAEIRLVDDQVGRFVAALRETGAYDRCVIAFTSDHGEEFWEHGGYSHGHALYEESIRVPLAIRAPGLPAGQRVAASVSTQSLYATLLDLLGEDAASGPLLASSLAPLARDPMAPFPDESVISGGGHLESEKVSVVRAGLKTIEHLDGSQAEVYDLASDPHERAPLSSAEGAVAAARAEVRDWIRAGQRARAARDEERSVEIEGETRDRLRELGYAD